MKNLNTTKADRRNQPVMTIVSLRNDNGEYVYRKPAQWLHKKNELFIRTNPKTKWIKLNGRQIASLKRVLLTQ